MNSLTFTNNQGYSFSLVGHSLEASIHIKDKFDTDLGTAPYIYLNDLTSEEREILQRSEVNARENLITQFLYQRFATLGKDQAMIDENRTFNVQCYNYKGLPFVVFEKYGLQGGGKRKRATFVLGMAEIAGGVLIASVTTAIAPVALPLLGAGIIATGISSMYYGYKTQEEKITAKDLAVQSAVNFAGGAVGGGAGIAVNALLSSTLPTLVTAAFSTAAQSVTNTTVSAATEYAIKQDAKSLNRLTPGNLIASAATGVLTGRVANVAQGALEQLGTQLATSASQGVAEIAARATIGGVAGAVSSTAVKITENALKKWTYLNVMYDSIPKDDQIEPGKLYVFVHDAHICFKSIDERGLLINTRITKQEEFLVVPVQTQFADLIAILQSQRTRHFNKTQKQFILQSAYQHHHFPINFTSGVSDAAAVGASTGATIGLTNAVMAQWQAPPQVGKTSKPESEKTTSSKKRSSEEETEKVSNIKRTKIDDVKEKNPPKENCGNTSNSKKDMCDNQENKGTTSESTPPSRTLTEQEPKKSSVLLTNDASSKQMKQVAEFLEKVTKNQQTRKLTDTHTQKSDNQQNKGTPDESATPSQNLTGRGTKRSSVLLNHDASNKQAKHALNHFLKSGIKNQKENELTNTQKQVLQEAKNKHKQQMEELKDTQKERMDELKDTQRELKSKEADTVSGNSPEKEKVQEKSEDKKDVCTLVTAPPEQIALAEQKFGQANQKVKNLDTLSRYSPVDIENAATEILNNAKNKHLEGNKAVFDMEKQLSEKFGIPMGTLADTLHNVYRGKHPDRHVPKRIAEALNTLKQNGNANAVAKQELDQATKTLQALKEPKCQSIANTEKPQQNPQSATQTSSPINVLELVTDSENYARNNKHPHNMDLQQRYIASRLAGKDNGESYDQIYTYFYQARQEWEKNPGEVTPYGFWTLTTDLLVNGKSTIPVETKHHHWYEKILKFAGRIGVGVQTNGSNLQIGTAQQRDLFTVVSPKNSQGIEGFQYPSIPTPNFVAAQPVQNEGSSSSIASQLLPSVLPSQPQVVPLPAQLPQSEGQKTSQPASSLPLPSKTPETQIAEPQRPSIAPTHPSGPLLTPQGNVVATIAEKALKNLDHLPGFEGGGSHLGKAVGKVANVVGLMDRMNDPDYQSEPGAQRVGCAAWGTTVEAAGMAITLPINGVAALAAGAGLAPIAEKAGDHAQQNCHEVINIFK